MRSASSATARRRLRLGSSRHRSPGVSPSRWSARVGGTLVALTTSGAAYCWGDESNVGLLGDGKTTGGSVVPTPVAGGLTFTTLSAGPSETCGVTTSGAAYCWGYNAFGQLGDGTHTTR